MKKIEITGVKEKLYHHKLKNGLSIYMLPNTRVKNFYLTLNVRFGSTITDFKYDKVRYKIPKGIAHYLEHLMFNMPDKNVFDYYSKLGSSVNAFTSHDVTCYEVFANSKFKENLSYLLKYVNTPFFTKEMVNGEKGIITEEIKMYEDNPSTSLFYELYNNLFIKDERQFLISGTVPDIKKIKLEDIEIAYKAFYHPQNMFLILTGNFNPEEAIAIVEETLSKIEIPKYIKPEIINVKEPFKVKNEYSSKKKNIDKPKIFIGMKIPKDNFSNLNIDLLQLKLYINLIMRVNFGKTSLFNEELISNKVISESVSTYLIETKDYFIEHIITSSEYPDYFIKRIKEKLANLEVSEEELQRKIKSSISSLIMLYDNIEAINNDLQDNLLSYNSPINDIYDIYNSLNINEIKKVIDKLKRHLITVTVFEPNEDTNE